jgi:hypothetical protein
MTSKKKTTIPPTASIKAVPGTKYVVIDGKYVARLLKPTIRGVEPQEYFNIFIPGKKSMTQLTAAEIALINPTSANASNE